jgi:hypothetical protein
MRLLKHIFIIPPLLFALSVTAASPNNANAFLGLSSGDRLYQAASRGDVLKARELVMDGANVNQRDKRNNTLLCKAQMKNDYQAMQILSMLGGTTAGCNYRGKKTAAGREVSELSKQIGNAVSSNGLLLGAGAAAGVLVAVSSGTDAEGSSPESASKGASENRDINDLDGDGRDDPSGDGNPGEMPILLGDHPGPVIIEKDNISPVDKDEFKIEICKKTNCTGTKETIPYHQKDSYIDSGAWRYYWNDVDDGNGSSSGTPLFAEYSNARSANRLGYTGFVINRDAQRNVDNEIPIKSYYNNLNTFIPERIRIGIIDSGFDIHLSGPANTHTALLNQYYTFSNLVDNGYITNPYTIPYGTISHLNLIDQGVDDLSDPDGSSGSGEFAVNRGTASASIIAANEESSVTGIAYEARLVPIGSYTANADGEMYDNGGSRGSGVYTNNEEIENRTNNNSFEEKGAGAAMLLAAGSGAKVIFNNWYWTFNDSTNGYDETLTANYLTDYAESDLTSARGHFTKNVWKVGWDTKILNSDTSDGKDVYIEDPDLNGEDDGDADNGVIGDGVDDYLHAISPYNTYLSQKNKNGKDRAIFIFPAGDDGYNSVHHLTNNSQINSAAPAIYDWLKGYFINVVAVQKTNDDEFEIATYSNGCGGTSDWCLAAFGGSEEGGEQITAAVNNGVTSIELYGTSYAAAQVAGAVALLQGAFPYLSGEAITTLLFETADSLGDADIYGHGMLNIERAFNPLGTIYLPIREEARANNSASMELEEASASFSGLFGEGVNKAVKGKTVMVMDEIGRGYYIPLEEIISGDPLNVEKINGIAALDALGSHYKEESIDVSKNLALKLNMKNEMIFENNEFNGTSETKLKSFGIAYSNYESLSQIEYSSELTENLDAGFNKAFNLNDQRIKKGSLINPYFNFADKGVSAIWKTNFSKGLKLGMGAFMAETDGYEESYEEEALMSTLDDEIETDDKEKDQVYGIYSSISQNLTESSEMGINFGVLREENKVLGSEFSGALAVNEYADTYFAGINSNVNISENTKLFGNYTYGLTSSNSISESLITDLSDIKSSAYNIGLNYSGFDNQNDLFGIILSKELSIDEAYLNMQLPYARDYEKIYYEDISLDISSQTTEYGIETFYQYDLGRLGKLNFSALHQVYDGMSEENSTTLMMKYSLFGN